MAFIEDLDMAIPTYMIYRDGEDVTNPLVFFPAKGSDELFDALRNKYPHHRTHSERMREATFEFLMEEREADAFAASVVSSTPLSSTQNTSPLQQWQSLSSTANTSPEMGELGTPSSDQDNMYRSVSQESCPPALEGMTSVFSLNSAEQPKQRLRRKMTEAEKAEYRIRRNMKACGKCKQRKRKCTHNQQNDVSAATNKVVKSSISVARGSKTLPSQDVPELAAFGAVPPTSTEFDDFTLLMGEAAPELDFDNLFQPEDVNSFDFWTPTYSPFDAVDLQQQLLPHQQRLVSNAGSGDTGSPWSLSPSVPSELPSHTGVPGDAGFLDLLDQRMHDLDQGLDRRDQNFHVLGQDLYGPHVVSHTHELELRQASPSTEYEALSWTWGADTLMERCHARYNSSLRPAQIPLQPYHDSTLWRDEPDRVLRDQQDLRETEGPRSTRLLDLFVTIPPATAPIRSGGSERLSAVLPEHALQEQPAVHRSRKTRPVVERNETASKLRRQLGECQLCTSHRPISALDDPGLFVARPTEGSPTRGRHVRTGPEGLRHKLQPTTSGELFALRRRISSVSKDQHLRNALPRPSLLQVNPMHTETPKQDAPCANQRANDEANHQHPAARGQPSGTRLGSRSSIIANKHVGDDARDSNTQGARAQRVASLRRYKEYQTMDRFWVRDHHGRTTSSLFIAAFFVAMLALPLTGSAGMLCLALLALVLPSSAGLDCLTLSCSPPATNTFQTQRSIASRLIGYATRRFPQARICPRV